MWTTVPQFIYYRLKARNAVSTLLRAGNLSLKGYLAHLYTTLLQDHIKPQCSSPRKGRDSVKLTALSTAIPRNTQNQEEAQLLAAPPMHQMQPNGSIKDHGRYTDVNKGMQTEDKKSRTSRRMKQEETQK